MTLEQVRTWVKAAIADGWSFKATYNQEPISQAVTLERDGFHVLAIMRPAGPTDLPWMHVRKTDDVSINAWGPDKLIIDVPVVYDPIQLKQNAYRCTYCKKLAHTQRIGFAGRACAECYTANVAKVEYKGWCD